MSRFAPIARLPVTVALIVLAGCGTGDLQPTGGSGTTDFYAEPPLAVRQIVLTENEGAPREIRLFIPEASGNFPLLQFQHGFTSEVDIYTDLLARLAGFGFVIAAPQMYVGDPSSAPTVRAETTDAVAVLAWVQDNVNGVLAARVTEFTVRAAPADTGLFGHSRGGQVAWRMIFDHPDTDARAVAGVDPVDGDAPPFPPGETGEMVTDDPGAFAFPFASLIIGMGMGGEGAPGFACAPTNRNYTFFYDASQPPRYEVVATDYGHSDMTNGDTPDPVCLGDTEGTRDLVRIFVAGQLAAYFTSVLKGVDEFGWLRDLGNAPVATTGRYEE